MHRVARTRAPRHVDHLQSSRRPQVSVEVQKKVARTNQLPTLPAPLITDDITGRGHVTTIHNSIVHRANDAADLITITVDGWIARTRAELWRELDRARSCAEQLSRTLRGKRAVRSEALIVRAPREGDISPIASIFFVLRIVLRVVRRNRRAISRLPRVYIFIEEEVR